MQRWFFLDDRKARKNQKQNANQGYENPKKGNAPELLSQQWFFSVSAPGLVAQEKVFITGSTPELGEWSHTRLVPLDQDSTTGIWSKSIEIPNICDVHYRYVIGMFIEGTNDVVVIRFESNIQPRVIPENMRHPVTDTFGEQDEQQLQVTKGWLTSQTMLQFKFINALKLKSRLATKNMHIKVTPVKLSFGGVENQVDDSSSQSIDSVDNNDIPLGSYVEVSTISSDPTLCTLQPQEQFGREYKPDDVLLINAFVSDVKAVAFLIDFFSYSSHSASDDPPCHVGYTYVLPNMFKPSDGSFMLPVTCNVKHRPLGTVHIEYMIVRPMPTQLCDLQLACCKFWNPAWTGLEVGHRGLGASFKTKESPIRENTIASLKKAAASGADMLEFDVQLSRDLIPVIYHDFHVCISLKRKKELEFGDMLELPVKDLTLERLQNLKVYHLIESPLHEKVFEDDDMEENQPFPTLEAALNAIDIHVGFNVELKWTMELDDGTFEMDNPFDMNLYVDKVLEVILQFAGERRIILSCFNPDVCTMVRAKQNKFPVAFLTQGATSKYQSYRDPRCRTIEAAVRTAISSDLLGIVVHTEDLLRDPTQVKLATDVGLVIFCWGEDNNDKNTIQKLKDMGLHAVIYDKLDELTTKQVKESIFLVEARDSMRELMWLGTPDAQSSGSSTSTAPGRQKTPPPFLDCAVRHRLQDNVSTVTSLESLACSIDLRDHIPDRPSKRCSNLISAVDKESQVKEQVNNFKNISGDGNDPSKKLRGNECL